MKMNPTVMGFFKKELVQTLRDPRMRIMLFVMPIIQMTLFGIAISTETRNIKLAAVYKPNDFLMRRIVERCYSSQWFIPAKTGDQKRRFSDGSVGEGRCGVARPRKRLDQGGRTWRRGSSIINRFQ